MHSKVAAGTSWDPGTKKLTVKFHALNDTASWPEAFSVPYRPLISGLTTHVQKYFKRPYVDVWEAILKKHAGLEEPA